MDRTIIEIDEYELLSQKIYKALKMKIMKGILKPGEKLFGNKVAKDLNVSRTPVREALQRLASEGFLEITPNKAMVVAKFSFEYAKEILEIRGVLEGLAARIAADKINEKEIKELEELFRKMVLSVKSNDLFSYCEYDDLFHDSIIKISKNQFLFKMRNYLENFIYRFRINSLTGVKSAGVKGRINLSLEEHKRILQAIKEKNISKSERTMKQHIYNTIQNIENNVINK